LPGNGGKALKIFYDNLAHDHGDFITYYTNPIGVTRVAKLLKMLAVKSGDLVCDVGCGDGCIADRVNKTAGGVVGLDVSDVRAGRVQERGIAAVCGDAASMPFGKDKFDRIMCSEVIEHVVEPESALTEINRVLKNSGKAVLTVPLNEVLGTTLLDVPDEELSRLNWVQISKEYGVKKAHLESYSEESFLELVKRCGFKVEEVDYTYDYTVRPGLVFNLILGRWRRLIKLLGERILHTIPGQFFIRFSLLLFYRKEKSKHHIIVTVIKA
jgi:ubiquinone/menaquinone biosynthesis C-methylase UbiE